MASPSSGFSLPLLAGLAVLTPGHASYAAGPWAVLVVGEQSEAERLATVDLQRYLGQVTGTVPEVVGGREWEQRPRPAVVLGTPHTNALLKRFEVDSLADVVVGVTALAVS